MIRVNAFDRIKIISETAEHSLVLASGHQAVAVEVERVDDTGESTFDGTALYVPGIHFKDLKVK